MSKKPSPREGLVPKRVVRTDGVETTVYVREEDGHSLHKSGKERKAIIDKAKPRKGESGPTSRLTAVTGLFNPSADNKRLSVIINDDTPFDLGSPDLDSQEVWIDGRPIKAEDLFGRFGLRLSRDEGDPLDGVYIVKGTEEDLAYFQEEFDDVFNCAAAETEKPVLTSTCTVDKYGAKHWRSADGKYHREGGPAIEYVNGTKAWYIDGEVHREDGPAVESADGSKEWHINGKLHREDGPAIDWASGVKAWYINGVRHREDGPAIEWPDGSKEWWVNGEELTEDEFNALQSR